MNTSSPTPTNTINALLSSAPVAVSAIPAQTSLQQQSLAVTLVQYTPQLVQLAIDEHHFRTILEATKPFTVNTGSQYRIIDTKNNGALSQTLLNEISKTGAQSLKTPQQALSDLSSPMLLIEQRPQSIPLTITTPEKGKLLEVIATTLSKNVQSGIVAEGKVAALTREAVTLQLGDAKISLPISSPKLYQGQPVLVELRPISEKSAEVIVRANPPKTESPTDATKSNQLAATRFPIIGNEKLVQAITLQSAKQQPLPLSPVAITKAQKTPLLAQTISDVAPKIDSNGAPKLVLSGQQWSIEQHESRVIGTLSLPAKEVSEVIKSVPKMSATLLSQITDGKTAIGSTPILQQAKANTLSNHQHIIEQKNTEQRLAVEQQFPQIKAAIQVMAKQALSQSASPTEALQKLIKQFEQMKPSAVSETTNARHQLKEQLLSLNIATTDISKLPPADPALATAQVTPDGKDAQQIKQLLTAPSLLTPRQLIMPSPTQSNFINGLITVIQLSLTARASRQFPQLSKELAAESEIKTKSAMGTGTSSPQRGSSNLLRDIAQLDQQSSLFKQAKSLLANHSQAKLHSAEQALQGEQSLYYVLPSSQHNQTPTELLIQRDSEKDNAQQKAKSERKKWRITMKLDVGELGEMLAKVKIKDELIDIDIYTSTDPLLHQVADTLPYLLKRLTAHGLEIAQRRFQRGVIPEHLSSRPYQILETQA